MTTPDPDSKTMKLRQEISGSFRSARLGRVG